MNIKHVGDTVNLVGQAVNKNLENDACSTFFTSSLPKIRWAMADESDDKKVKTEDNFKDKEEFASLLKEYKRRNKELYVTMLHRKRREISQKFSHFYCKLCNVHCTSQVDLNNHKAGKKHRENKLSRFDCNLCNVKSSSQISLNAHRAGKQHKINMKNTSKNKSKLIRFNNFSIKKLPMNMFI